MPRTARIKSASDIYHIIQRGINRQRIFYDDEDYQKYLFTLQKYRKTCEFKLYAWCLMPNHIHLLIKEGTQPLSVIFRSFGSSFVYWYNRKHKRTGHLFQDRYKAEAIEHDAYFLSAIRYIHLNPVKAGLCDTPAEYPYSSYNRYFGDRFSDTEIFFNLVTGKEFKEFHQLDNNDVCMDIDEAENFRLPDNEVLSIIRRSIGDVPRISLLSDQQKGQLIRTLLTSGASIKQINRLTGISIRTIQLLK